LLAATIIFSEIAMAPPLPPPALACCQLAIYLRHGFSVVYFLEAFAAADDAACLMLAPRLMAAADAATRPSLR